MSEAILYRRIGDICVPHIESDQANISSAEAVQIARRRHLRDFVSSQLSLQDVDDAAARQDLIVDDHDDRQFVRSVDWIGRNIKIGHYLPAFRGTLIVIFENSCC